MSNVLIGVIGVILFIGLALAGALILGDDFRTASGNSQTAAIQNQLKQVADAVSMSNLKTGTPVAPHYVNASSALIPRFLKTVPINPVKTGDTFLLLNANGVVATNDAARTVVMLMDKDETGRGICEAVARATGQLADDVAFDTANGSVAQDALPAQAGCAPYFSYYVPFQKI